MNPENKTCIITGGSSGIGKALATKLAKKGAEVVIINRSEKRGKAALTDIINESGNRNVHLHLADLSLVSEVKETANWIKSRFESIDLLVNVAGTLSWKRKITAEGLELNFSLNYLSGFVLTNMLLNSLKRAGQASIINVTSIAHWLGSIPFDNLSLQKRYFILKAYGNSKLAIVLFTKLLAEKLRGSNVTVNCIHPGIVATGIIEHVVKANWINKLASKIFLSPEQSADFILNMIENPAYKQLSGAYFSGTRTRIGSPSSHDKDLGEKLWQTSIKLAKMNGTSCT